MLLVFCMVCTLMPVGAFSADTGAVAGTSSVVGKVNDGEADREDPQGDSGESAVCQHEHNEECGYTEGSQAVVPSDCTYTHIHDEACGYTEGTAEIPCDKGCEADHEEGCTFAIEVTGTDCTDSHTHDDDCGFAEGSEETAGTDCTHECELCKPSDQDTEQPKQDCICDPVIEEGEHTSKDCPLYEEKAEPDCDCTVKCTLADEESSIEEAVKADCPLCSVEKADLAACKGEVPAGMMTPRTGVIEVNNEKTFKAALGSVTDGGTVKLTANITLSAVTAIPDNTFSIDLNGQTLDCGLFQLTYRGKKNVTIEDTSSAQGKITSANTSSSIYLFGDGILTITGGTIENTSAGKGIYNYYKAIINISGGEVHANRGDAIYNNDTGVINISGTAHVGATTGRGIYNYSTGPISISDEAIVTSANTNSRTGTIHFAAGNRNAFILFMTGGIIENTASGNAIYNESVGRINISGGEVRANTGNGIYAYTTSDANIYISGTAQVRSNKGSAIYLDGSYYLYISGAAQVCSDTGDAIYNDDEWVFMNLMIFGTAQVRSNTGSAIHSRSGGIITIKDDAIITSGNTNNYRGTMHFPVDRYRTNVTMTGGTVENTATGKGIYNRSGGDIKISGGKVSAGAESAIECVNKNSVAISGDALITSASTTGTITLFGNYTNAALTITDGTVENTAAGYGIYNYSQCPINISGGTVSATTGRGIYNYFDTTINISGGTVSATTGSGIYNYSSGKINLSGDGIITSANTAPNGGTIAWRNSGIDSTVLIMTGGTVENTATNGIGIYSYALGKISIPSGTVVIRGGKLAMNQVPDTSDYANVLIGGSKTDATGTVGLETGITLNNGAIGNYKYLKFEESELEETPTATFTATDADSGTLSGLTAGTNYKYSLDGGTNWEDFTGAATIAIGGNITTANGIWVVKKGNGTTTVDSEPQQITVTQAGTPTTIGKTDETSALNDGTITGVTTDMEYKLSTASSWTAITGTSVTGCSAGTYRVRVKANGAVLASTSITVTIEPFVKSNPTAGDLNYNLTGVVYNGSAQPVAVTAKDGKNLGDITVKYDGSTTEPTNAGTYAVTVDIAGSDEYNAAGLSLGNYTINRATYTGTKEVATSVTTSGKAGATVALPTLPDGAWYGTPTLLSHWSKITDMSVSGTTLTYTADSDLAGITGMIAIPVTSATNYDDYEVIVTVTYTAKTPQNISYTTTSVNKTYGDATFTNPLTKTTVNGAITYTTDNTSVATVDETTGEVTIVGYDTDGTATITATAAETDTHAQAKASYTVTVAKKALTLKADDQSMTTGGTLPTFTYTATGLVNGDTVTVDPSMTTSTDGNTVGEFNIVISDGTVANSRNYTIAYTNGKLTVSDAPIVTDTITVTPPLADKPNTPTQGEIKVNGKVDNNGNATVSITDKNINDAYNKALADAKKNGNEQNGITLVLNVDTGNKTATSLTVNLPKTVQDTIISKKIVNTVVVDNPDIKIGMDLATVKEINKQAKADVSITATKADSNKLTGSAKTAIGTRPVFDLKVNYGSDKQVTSFGAGSVAVEIPYTLSANEKAGNVQAVYVDANGKVQWLTSSVYDSVNKVIRFNTNHFSTYGIGYKTTNTTFIDTVNHWAKENIEFVVSRGLFSGTSSTTFSPNTAMTRGMFVTALGRLAEVDVSKYTKSGFNDVKSDAYYMEYVEWATNNGIVNGIGDDKFAPDQSITREQMAVIMVCYTKAIGFTLPKVHAENIFADNASISRSAKDAVKVMQMAGVISAKDGNKFDPQGTATRAEVSTMIKRFVELTISRDTAQGWMMNDSGKWMYYENGKAVTGKNIIDGLNYNFNEYGETKESPKILSYGTHTVKKGESWFIIAKEYNTSIFELRQLNKKKQQEKVTPNEVLIVPVFKKLH